MANPWDEVFARVRASRAPEEVWIGVPEAELDAAEAELGLPLPASYRAFATEFGIGGEFWGIYRMKSVVEQDPRYQNNTLVNWTRWMQANIVEEIAIDMSLPKEQIRRFVFFGDNCGGGDFVWDTGNPTSANPTEYPVYYFPGDDTQIDRLAATFVEFVSWLDTDWRRETREEAEPDILHIPWYPYRAREKESSREADVKLWLSANNHTARDLVLAIRDEGRVEAFPILADALEEAGCTNADLLDSCRTGTPDIDGRWVLQVLLGKGEEGPLLRQR